MKVEYEGTTFELPDGISDAEMMQLVEQAKPKTLMSLEGVKSTLRLVGPSLARGILGAELAGMEEIQLARDKKVAEGIPLTPEEQADLEQMRIRRQAIKEADLEIERVRGMPSKPLEVAQSAVQSVAANLPGVAAAVATRQAGPIAAAPALIQAGEHALGQAYADVRVGKGAEIEPSLKHARVSGAAEVGFELLPTTWLIKNLGKTGAVEFATKYIARELATELPTTATNKISERLFIEPEKPLGEFLDEMKQELVNTALVTPFAAGMTGGIARGIARAGQPSGITPDFSQEEPPVTEPPVFDIPTTPTTPEQQAGVQALIDQLNQDLIPPEQIEAAREEARKFDEAKAAPKLENAQVAWQELETAPVSKMDAGELGASAKQAENAPGYINPNNQPRLERQFSFGPEEAIGKTPSQILPKASTYVLGEPTLDRPAALLGPMRETVEEWRQKFLPNATIVLSNEQLFTDSALGWHYSTRPGFHMIVPAVLRNAKEGLGAFNKNTQTGIFYNTTHEFGHALVRDRLLEGTDPLIAQGVWSEAEQGLISEQALAAVPNERSRALLQTFNEIKARILDNSMTAQEFVEQWLGPAKEGRATFLKDLGVAPTDRAMAVAEALARRAADKSRIKNEVKRKELREQLVREYFGLEEFLAEQLSRHAYARRWEAKTPLGKMFKEAIDSLRTTLQSFFKHLKASGGIKATTTFQEWIDDLARADRALTEPAKRTRAAKNGPAKIKAAPKVQVPKAPKKRPRLQHNVEAESDQVKVDTAKRLVADLIRTKAIEPNSKEMKDLLGFARNKEWDEFTEAYNSYGVKRVKFELDDMPEEARPVLKDMSVIYGNLEEKQALEPSTMADAINEWVKNGFRSKYFKAWFGNWEEARPGIRTEGVSAVRTHNGEPLPVYHLTRFGPQLGKLGKIAFTKFSRGDIGFHFGTVRAANIRGTRGALSSLAEMDWINEVYAREGREAAAIGKLNLAEDAYIIPAVLNIHNPLRIAMEKLSMWQSPSKMLTALQQMNIISTDEAHDAWLQVQMIQKKILDASQDEPLDLAVELQDYSTYEPVRQLLMRKGYDGIAYHNLVEGDLSYVAFYPNQVKSLLGHKTFSRSEHMHLELDFDKSSPEGEGASRMYRGLRNFHPNPSGWRKALRRAQNLQYHTLQIQQLAQLNPDLDNLISFNEFNTRYNLRKNGLQAPADSITQRWQILGKENVARVNRALIEEMESGQHWFEPDNPTLSRDGKPKHWTQWRLNAKGEQELRKRGIDISTPEGQELAELVLDVKNHILFRLNEWERVLGELLANRYGANQNALLGKLVDLNNHVAELRRFPFFPQGRFGNHMLIVERAKQDGGWEVVYREAFESKDERDKAWAIADARKDSNERVHAKDVQDSQYVLMALPTDFLELVATELDLTSEQVARITELLQPIKKEKALKSYDIARLGIKGYTSDALRSFANYAWHDSNALAKVEYRWRFNLAIRGMRAQVRDAQFASPPNPQETWRLEQVTRAMERAKDYIMAPPNELQSVRAFVSVAYLGLNIKTALLNLYGLVTTWSDVTSRLGNIEGQALMNRATLKAFRSINIFNFNERNQGDYLAPDERVALDRALEEGVLSQSYAYHLAGLANQGNLNRLIPGYNLSSRIAKRVVDLSMWTFRLTELSARRATFLAEYEIAKRQHGPGAEAYAEAVRKTNILQNDYSLGNRVPFMRGGFAGLGPVAPLATVFMSFAQHMAFHAYGGYELGERRAARLRGENPRTAWGGYTMKIWLLTLLIAGYEGLPGAENILDLIEAAWRRFGGKKPIRQTLREYIQAVDPGIDPQAVAHGLGHNVAGFDISRSVGFGRFVPGTDVLARQHDNPDEFAGTLTLDMLGASGSFIRFGMGAFMDRKPLSEYLTRMPGGIGNIYTSLYWAENGVRTPMGSLVTRDLETGKPRELTDLEIWGKALGFNPTVVSQNRAIRWEQYDRKIYWQTRRSRLLDDIWRARWQRDREAEADARKAVTDFNLSVPSDYPSLKVRPIDIARSIQKRTRDRRAEEAGIAPERRYRELYRDVRGSFSPQQSEPGDIP